MPRALPELLAGFTELSSVPALSVAGLAQDSRRVRRGDLFLACRGLERDGADFLGEARRAGAVGALVESGAGAARRRVDAAFPVLEVPELRARIGLLADRYYGHPSNRLRVIGVTGSNGKTTVSSLLAGALCRLSGNARACGVMGTLGTGFPGALRPSPNTTPGAVELQRGLHEFSEAGASHAVLEVSSHALRQKRVAGVCFTAAIFTNLGRDHLDYHASLEAYWEAKKSLFLLPRLGAAVINVDDRRGWRLVMELPVELPVVIYRLRRDAPGRGVRRGTPVSGRCRESDAGLELELRSPWGAARLRSPLLGAFNGANLLACWATLALLGHEPEAAASALECERAGPAGRMERFPHPRGVLVVVDYAHAPESLGAALLVLRRRTRGRLWCVFGCGGERDRGKRPRMGALATWLADQVVLTSDNPRGEDPQAIIDEILAGVRRRKRVSVEVSRERAIRMALEAAAPGDTVLVAGKGHEQFQYAGGVARPHSDRELVRRLVEQAR